MKGEYLFKDVPARRWWFGRRPAKRRLGARAPERPPQVYDTRAYTRLMALAGRALRAGGYVEITFEPCELKPPSKSRLRSRPIYERFSGRIVWTGAGDGR